MRIAVLVSGSGSNLQAFIDKREAGLLDVDISVVLSNNPDAYGLVRAKKAGIATWAESHKNYPSREAFDAQMIKVLKDADVELVVLAGYMRLLSTNFLDQFTNRVVNIHPSILPSFAGATAVADARGYGVKVTGCTVHFVEEKVDSGPVIIQATLPVAPDESEEDLLNRVHALEHRIYPQAVQWIAENRISLDGRWVKLAPAAKAKVFATNNEELASQWLIYPPLEQGF